MSEDVLHLEDGHSKLRVLQGFNKFIDKKNDEEIFTDTQRVTMRPINEAGPLEVTPFTIFPSEFFIESDGFVDVYVIFNPKEGQYYNKTIGFMSNDKFIEFFQLSGAGMMVNLN